MLILDEPTDGLDPNQKHEMRSLIRTLAPSKAIIVSTHILEEVEAICNPIITKLYQSAGGAPGGMPGGMPGAAAGAPGAGSGAGPTIEEVD